MKQNQWLDVNISQLTDKLDEDINTLKQEMIEPERIVLSKRAKTILNESNFTRFDKTDNTEDLKPQFAGVETEYYPEDDMDELYYIVYSMPEGINYRFYASDEVLTHE